MTSTAATAPPALAPVLPAPEPASEEDEDESAVQMLRGHVSHVAASWRHDSPAEQAQGAGSLHDTHPPLPLLVSALISLARASLTRP